MLDTPGKFSGQQGFIPTALSVHPEGLALMRAWPVPIWRKPLFLPFAQMTVRTTTWPALDDPYALPMEAIECVELILSPAQLEWLRSHGAPL